MMCRVLSFIIVCISFRALSSNLEPAAAINKYYEEIEKLSDKEISAMWAALICDYQKNEDFQKAFNSPECQVRKKFLEYFKKAIVESEDRSLIIVCATLFNTIYYEDCNLTKKFLESVFDESSVTCDSRAMENTSFLILKKLEIDFLDSALSLYLKYLHTCERIDYRSLLVVQKFCKDPNTRNSFLKGSGHEYLVQLLDTHYKDLASLNRHLQLYPNDKSLEAKIEAVKVNIDIIEGCLLDLAANTDMNERIVRAISNKPGVLRNFSKFLPHMESFRQREEFNTAYLELVLASKVIECILNPKNSIDDCLNDASVAPFKKFSETKEVKKAEGSLAKKIAMLGQIASQFGKKEKEKFLDAVIIKISDPNLNLIPEQQTQYLDVMTHLIASL